MTTFEPSFDLIQEDDCNTLLLYLPGFTKEELRVQLTRSKVLKISGTRAIGENKWSSFQKDFQIPENCDTSKISAKFEEGILYIRQPKVIVPEDKITLPAPSPAPKIDPPPKIAPNLGESPKTASSHLDEPPKTAPTLDESPKTAPSRLDEFKQQGGVEDFPDKKKEERRSKKDEKVKKDDDRKVTAGKSEKVSTGVGGYSYSVVNAAGRLKMEREKVVKIMLFLFAFALGIYVSNNLPNWFSRSV